MKALWLNAFLVWYGNMFTFSFRSTVIHIMKLQVVTSEMSSIHSIKQSLNIDIKWKNRACLEFSIVKYFSLFQFVKNFLGPLCQRSESVKMNAGTWFKEGRWYGKIFLQGYVIWWRNSFPKRGENLVSFLIALNSNVGKEYKVDLMST